MLHKILGASLKRSVEKNNSSFFYRGVKHAKWRWKSRTGRSVGLDKQKRIGCNGKRNLEHNIPLRMTNDNDLTKLHRHKYIKRERERKNHVKRKVFNKNAHSRNHI